MDKLKYSVIQSDNSSFKWAVQVKSKTGTHILCYIPNYYQLDKNIAECIVKSLENGKFVPDVTI